MSAESTKHGQPLAAADAVQLFNWAALTLGIAIERYVDVELPERMLRNVVSNLFMELPRAPDIPEGYFDASDAIEAVFDELHRIRTEGGLADGFYKSERLAELVRDPDFTK